MNNNETIESIARLGIDLFAEATDQGLARKCLEEAVEACRAAGMSGAEIDRIVINTDLRLNTSPKSSVDKELFDVAITGITGVARYYYADLGNQQLTRGYLAVRETQRMFNSGCHALRQRTWEKREDGSCQHQDQDQHQPTAADIQWIDEETT